MLEIEHVDAPSPGAGEVRVKLEGRDVCGSNLPVCGRSLGDFRRSLPADATDGLRVTNPDGWWLVLTIGCEAQDESGLERLRAVARGPKAR